MDKNTKKLENYEIVYLSCLMAAILTTLAGIILLLLMLAEPITDAILIPTSLLVTGGLLFIPYFTHKRGWEKLSRGEKL